jgi:hypothetical protein
MIVCVNKMDDKGVGYSEARYKEIKDELSKFLTKTGYKVIDDKVASFLGIRAVRVIRILIDIKMALCIYKFYLLVLLSVWEKGRRVIKLGLQLDCIQFYINTNKELRRCNANLLFFMARVFIFSKLHSCRIRKSLFPLSPFLAGLVTTCSNAQIT